MVSAAFGVVKDKRHEGLAHSNVASQLIRDHPLCFAFLNFQQPAKEAFHPTLIATELSMNINYVSVLVNDAPEIVSPTLDIHKDSTQVSNVPSPSPKSHLLKSG
jgi:hypothetical protein